MIAKHTPGPWVVSPHCPSYVIKQDDNGSRHIAGCAHAAREGGSEEDKANARLIKAAPKMLDALRECITEGGALAMTNESRHAVDYARCRLDAINEIAQAAIAEAEGGGE